MSRPKNEPHYELKPNHQHSICNRCSAKIYWVKTAKGKSMPCDADGFSHFGT